MVYHMHDIHIYVCHAYIHTHVYHVQDKIGSDHRRARFE